MNFYNFPIKKTLHDITLLYITQKEIIQLADLGSVCNIHADPPHSNYIATRWYRAPEILLTSGYYGAKVDIWALGCVLYELLALRPLFTGENELDQLHKIHLILGSPTERILRKFPKISIDFKFPYTKPKPLLLLLPHVSPSALDLLKNTLIYYPNARISIYKLMDHPYFYDIRYVTDYFWISRLVFTLHSFFAPDREIIKSLRHIRRRPL